MPGRRLESAIRSLKEDMARTGGLLVAFSGGVDSAVVAGLAREALGRKALAVTVCSQTYTAEELKEARKLARLIGIRHIVITYDELKDPRFRGNPPDRCYLCREGMAVQLKAIARREGIRAIADGANFSDLSEHRPGIAAATRAGILHPLMEHRIGKREVRGIARALRLPVHDRPSSACLSSRIPYGEPITPEKLERVARAEAYLRRLGFRQVRVRSHGPLARIEVEKGALARLMRKGTYTKVAAYLKRLGFVYVTADMQGYRSGSMDEALEGKGTGYRGQGSD
jgi:uncharacterized protein